MTENAIPITKIPVEARKKRWGQMTVWVAVAAVLALVGFKLYQVTLGPVSTGKAPDLTLTTFDGESYTLSALRGRVVVINFWASWCGPCELEAADLEQFWRDYQDRGVLLLGVDYVDTKPEALAYLEKWNVTYPNGPDLRTSISQAYRIRGVPETFVVDQEGNLAKTIIGPTTYAELAAVIDPLLAR